MADSATSSASATKPSSSVKLVLLGEAAVGKVCLSVPVWSYRTHQIRWHVVISVVSLYVGRTQMTTAFISRLLRDLAKLLPFRSGTPG